MVTPERKVGQVLGVYELTGNIAKTSRITGVAESTCRDLVRASKRKKEVNDDPVALVNAYEKPLDPRLARALRRTFENNPFQTVNEVADLYEVHRTTLARYLKKIGLSSHVMKHTFLLDKRKVGLRLDWAHANLQTDWRTMIFTDESMFQTKYQNHERVVRPPGKRAGYDRKYSKPKMISGWSSVSVWGALAYGKRFPLMRVEGAIREAYPDIPKDETPKLNGERYTRLVLFDRLSLFAAELAREGRQGIVVEDGASIHTCRQARRMRDELGMTGLQHPPSSPDLNPIEHLWHIIKHRIWSRKSRPRNKDQLWRAIVEEYNAIPQSILDALVIGMVPRPAEVIAAKGWHTGH